MGRSDEVDFFRLLESHRSRLFVRVMRRLPRGPRCALCRAPYKGIGGRVMGAVGFAPSRKNPRLCIRCFDEGQPFGPGVSHDIRWLRAGQEFDL